MCHIPDQFQVDSEVLVDYHVAKFIHTTPWYFGVLAGKSTRYARRCFAGQLQRMKRSPVEGLSTSFELFIRYAFQVV